MADEMWSAFRSCVDCDVHWHGPAVCWSCGQGGYKRVIRQVGTPSMQNPSTWRASDRPLPPKQRDDHAA